MAEPAAPQANGAAPGGGGPAGYHRVLVAYDGSPSAEDALALGRRLCDPSGGALILGCVVSARPWHRNAPHGHDAEGTESMLSDVRARLPAGLPIALRTPSASSPARGLTEIAEHEHADVVAVGSEKGAAGERIGLTRTAGRLLHGAPCAVAVAPPGLRETGPFRHIGVALDDSAEATAALAVAFAIAGRDGSAMTLYSALDELTDPGEAGRRRLRLALQERLDRAADSAPAGVNPGTVLLRGPAGQVIAEACDGVVDLLVLGSRGYGPLQRALLGSVSEELVARARHPVLVIPRQGASAVPA